VGVKYLHGQDTRHHVDNEQSTSDSSIQWRCSLEERNAEFEHGKMKEELHSSSITKQVYSGSKSA
jgi:hypothetical protein